MDHGIGFARRHGVLQQQWLLYLLLIGAGVTVLARLGWTAFWTPLHVQTMSPPFADLRSIQGGLVSLARGFWPQRVNPGDPWGRPMDYPSVWLWLASVLRFRNEAAFLAFGTSSVLLFVGACTYLLARYPSWIMLVGAVSPAALLAIERGNTDMLSFVLLLACAGLGRVQSSVLFFVATATKIFPGFVLHVPAVQRDWRRLALYAAGAIAAGLLLRNQLPIILHGNTAVGPMSYGTPTLIWALGRVAIRTGVPAPVMLVATVIVMAAALTLAFKMCPVETPTDAHSRALFLTGGSIYIYSYMFAANWDYRLIFVLPCLPYLRRALGRYGHLCCACALIALYAVWLADGRGTVLLVQAAEAGLFVMLIPPAFAPLRQATSSSPAGAGVSSGASAPNAALGSRHRPEQHRLAIDGGADPLSEARDEAADAGQSAGPPQSQQVVDRRPQRLSTEQADRQYHSAEMARSYRLRAKGADGNPVPERVAPPIGQCAEAVVADRNVCSVVDMPPA
jgi:hypothetical protein